MPPILHAIRFHYASRSNNRNLWRNICSFISRHVSVHDAINSGWCYRSIVVSVLGEKPLKKAKRRRLIVTRPASTLISSSSSWQNGYTETEVIDIITAAAGALQFLLPLLLLLLLLLMLLLLMMMMIWEQEGDRRRIDHLLLSNNQEEENWTAEASTSEATQIGWWYLMFEPVHEWQTIESCRTHKNSRCAQHGIRRKLLMCPTGHTTTATIVPSRAYISNNYCIQQGIHRKPLLCPAKHTTSKTIVVSSRAYIKNHCRVQQQGAGYLTTVQLLLLAVVKTCSKTWATNASG